MADWADDSQIHHSGKRWHFCFHEPRSRYPHHRDQVDTLPYPDDCYKYVEQGRGNDIAFRPGLTSAEPRPSLAKGYCAHVRLCFTVADAAP